jgi:hypothetical protein
MEIDARRQGCGTSPAAASGRCKPVAEAIAAMIGCGLGSAGGRQSDREAVSGRARSSPARSHRRMGQSLRDFGAGSRGVDPDHDLRRLVPGFAPACERLDGAHR